MSAQVVIPLISALVSAIVVGGFTIWNTRFTQRQQTEQQERQRQEEREREYRVDTRALRDAKRERLRLLYIDLLRSAWTMSDFPVDMQMGPGEETDEAKKGRLTKILDRASRGVDEALVRLALERDATTIRENYTEVKDAFRHYRQAWSREDWDAAQQFHAKLFNTVSRLEGTIRQQLTELDQPTPTSIVPQAQASKKSWWSWPWKRG